MRKSVSRIGSAVLELLLPSAQAQACTQPWCENNSTGTKHRCCHQCPNGTLCGSWLSGRCQTGSC